MEKTVAVLFNIIAICLHFYDINYFKYLFETLWRLYISITNSIFRYSIAIQKSKFNKNGITQFILSQSIEFNIRERMVIFPLLFDLNILSSVLQQYTTLAANETMTGWVRRYRLIYIYISSCNSSTSCTQSILLAMKVTKIPYNSYCTKTEGLAM